MGQKRSLFWRLPLLVAAWLVLGSFAATGQSALWSDPGLSLAGMIGAMPELAFAAGLLTVDLADGLILVLMILAPLVLWMVTRTRFWLRRHLR